MVRDNVELYRESDETRRKRLFQQEFTEDQLNEALEYGEQALRRRLGSKKVKLFDTDVLPFLNSMSSRSRDDDGFDLSIAQRWILNRVMELGWTEEQFGAFDRSRMYGDGREARKAERIGKKYQWLAYHEFLARVSDNFIYKGDEHAERQEQYEGPWQLSTRDIDPSVLITRTRREVWVANTNTWWFPVRYSTWTPDIDDQRWLERADDMPQVEQLIEVVNPADGSQWINLAGFYRWQQPVPPGEDHHETLRRDIWYMLTSYIVKKADQDELFAWATQQDFTGRWMPEANELYRVFLGEFFWSPAFAYHNIPYYSHPGWTRGWDERIPKEVFISTDRYSYESSNFDCSVEDNINISLPCQLIVDGMGLQWNGVEGHFFDRNGILMAFDPSVKTKGPGAVLIHREKFLNFLDEHGYALLWVVLGERDVIGGNFHHEWQGRLELSGTYTSKDGQIRGEAQTRFRSRTG